MREDGYSLSQRALSFNTTALKIAKEEVVIANKLEASHPHLTSSPKDEFMEALHSAGGRDTLTMMRDRNIHPDATT
jgi:hypothetical protein